MPTIALRHTLFCEAFSIDLLISDVIGHTCRTERVMTFLLTLPKCSKAQVLRPALIYEHCDHMVPNDEQHSFRFKDPGFFILCQHFQRYFLVIGWCRAKWEILRTEIGQIGEPFQVTLLYSSCLEENGATVALDALEFIHCELGKAKVPIFLW